MADEAPEPLTPCVSSLERQHVPILGDPIVDDAPRLRGSIRAVGRDRAAGLGPSRRLAACAISSSSSSAEIEMYGLGEKVVPATCLIATRRVATSSQTAWI